MSDSLQCSPWPCNKTEGLHVNPICILQHCQGWTPVHRYPDNREAHRTLMHLWTYSGRPYWMRQQRVLFHTVNLSCAVVKPRSMVKGTAEKTPSENIPRAHKIAPTLWNMVQFVCLSVENCRKSESKNELNKVCFFWKTMVCMSKQKQQTLPHCTFTTER